MRGEHGLTLILNCWPAGSSPRARGAPVQLGVDGVVLGIIPACARSTSCRTARPAAPWDHPRVRGEHVTLYEIAVGKPGSSPRARGAPAPIDHHRPPGGIIPACAGSTAVWRAPRRGSGDHPRVRGEHRRRPRRRPAATGIIPACAGSTRWETRRLGGTGSYPRARGARRPVRKGCRCRGIIPACAGSTSGRPRARRDGRDHPRVRGEHTWAAAWSLRTVGSSPRARGAHRGDDRLRTLRGIIPACAGSTLLATPLGAGHRDHPRVRGEHSSPASPSPEPRGSSPRARGAPTGHLAGGRGAGIIPACAGSTSSRPSSLSPRWDHPRVRGEHKVRSELLLDERGSSPRARGALPPGLRLDVPRGIIPACAGSTRRGVRGDPEGRIIPACAGSTTPCSRWSVRAGDHPRVRGEHVTRPW